jgi:hypothetical protein
MLSFTHARRNSAWSKCVFVRSTMIGVLQYSGVRERVMTCKNYEL